MNTRLAIIAFCLFSYECSSYADKSLTVKLLNPIPEYPALEINTELLAIKDTIPFAPESIWVEDTLLIIKTQHKTGFLRLYSLSSGELVKSYGAIGRGPGEYLYPKVFMNAKGEYIIADRLKFGIVHIDQMLLQENYKAKMYYVEKGLSAVNFISMLSDNNTVIFNSGSDENQLCFMKLDDMKIEPYNHYPIIQGVKITNFIASTNIFRSSMSRNDDYVYAAYIHYPIIDIISIEDKTVKRSMHPLTPSANRVTMIDPINAVIDNKFIFYLASYVINSGFYTLYFGDSEDNIENLRTMPEILKYDLSGDLLVRYKLNRLVYDFCIDESGENGYFLSIDKDNEPVVLKASLMVID